MTETITTRPTITTIPSFDIKTTYDIKLFFDWLYEHDILLHPDDSFTFICDFAEQENEEPSINRGQAEYLDTIMQKCFEVCEENNADIYGICIFCNEQQQN